MKATTYIIYLYKEIDSLTNREYEVKMTISEDDNPEDWLGDKEFKEIGCITYLNEDKKEGSEDKESKES